MLPLRELSPGSVSAVTQSYCGSDGASPARHHRPKPSLRQKLGHHVALVALDLDLPVLDGATRPARLLHLLRELTLFRFPDPHKTRYRSHRFTSSPSRQTANFHSTTIFIRLPSFGRARIPSPRLRRHGCRLSRTGRQISQPTQRSERIMPQFIATISGYFATVLAHSVHISAFQHSALQLFPARPPQTPTGISDSPPKNINALA